MNNEIAAYKPTEAAVAGLVARFKDVVFDVATVDGLADAKGAYKEVNSHSIILEKGREKEKADSLAHGRYVDSEAKRISEQLDGLRLPIKAQIEVETKREERRIEQVKADAVARMEAEAKALKDAEEAKMAEARAEIAKQQAAMEEAGRQSRLKIEEEEREARAARENADREARVAREAEEAKLKAERDKLEAQKRAQEDVARKAREAEEARQREVLRQKNELMDGSAALQSFVARFGKRAEFATVVAFIKEFLKETA